MPYIDQNDRIKLVGIETSIGWLNSMTPGELNYLITFLCNWYITKKGKNYTHINDIVGALECAKQEFYRRLAAPYEDTKIKDNGDVY